MGQKDEKDEKDPSRLLSVETAEPVPPYPKCVFFILGNEFCERFSFYGMRTVLVLFLTNSLKFEDHTATAIYHAFTMLCYFTPLLGAPLADGILGKFWTILSLSLVYICGLTLMAITAIPPVGGRDGTLSPIGPLVGLVLIGFGTGGIKPCVAAFGGDQFVKGQEKQLQAFFSVFYMSINLGSLLSTYLTPIFRSEVECWEDDCYPLAFGVPAALLVVALLLFILGKPLYKINKPQGENVVIKVLKCIGHAISQKFKSKEKKEHWLDYAEPEYDPKFVLDMKGVMKVLVMFIPLPVFWALFDQTGSRWVLQADKMRGQIGDSTFDLKPDQMQLINPLFIVILIPIFEAFVWPCFRYFKIPNKPLQKMSVGMFLAGCSFIIAMFLQLEVEKSLVNVPDTETRLLFMNAGPCNLKIADDAEVFPADSKLLLDKLIEKRLAPEKEYQFKFFWDDECPFNDRGNELEVTFSGKQEKGYTIVVGEDIDASYKITGLKSLQYEDNLDKTSKSEISHRTVSWLYGNTDVVYWSYSTYKNQWYHDMAFATTSEFTPNNATGQYDLLLHDPSEEDKEKGFTNVTEELDYDTGATYTIIVRNEPDEKPPGFGYDKSSQYQYFQFEVVPANNFSILWQVPQFFVLTVGEVVFSVTGLEFAYSQAPPTMKALMQAAWLLTVAFGNLIVVIVAETQFMPTQWSEFLFFACLIFFVDIIFAIMAYFYKYVEHEQAPHDDGEIVEPLPEKPGLNEKTKTWDNFGYADSEDVADERF